MKSGKALLGRRGQCPGPADIWPFGGCLSSQSRKAVGNWVEKAVLCPCHASSPLAFALWGCSQDVSFQCEYLAPPVQLRFSVVFDWPTFNDWPDIQYAAMDKKQWLLSGTGCLGSSSSPLSSWTLGQVMAPLGASFSFSSSRSNH